VKLREKSTYRFRIIRLITLPDESRSWVLTHDGEDRFLLPVEYYEEYGFAEGMELRCRVDKINCTGRIFLEPEHPCYREGERYSYTFVDEEQIQDQLGNSLSKLTFKGIKGEDRQCITRLDRVPYVRGDIVEVKVYRIKKGEVMFEPIVDSGEAFMHEGLCYLFSVTGTGEGSIMVEGPGGVVSVLDAEHYMYHQLQPGSMFRGTLLKWMPGGVPLIEPEHPVYQPGEIYPFKVLRVEEADHPYEGSQQVMIVEDCFGQEIKVYPGKKFKSEMPERLHCLVERMKKGRPVLRLA
jgi:hypothetical protein